MIAWLTERYRMHGTRACLHTYTQASEGPAPTNNLTCFRCQELKSVEDMHQSSLSKALGHQRAHSPHRHCCMSSTPKLIPNSHVLNARDNSSLLRPSMRHHRRAHSPHEHCRVFCILVLRHIWQTVNKIWLTSVEDTHQSSLSQARGHWRAHSPHKHCCMSSTARLIPNSHVSNARDKSLLFNAEHTPPSESPFPSWILSRVFHIRTEAYLTKSEQNMTDKCRRYASELAFQSPRPSESPFPSQTLLRVKYT